MSADLLRKAATILRDRATSSFFSSPGPWKSMHHGVATDDGQWVCTVSSTLGKYEPEAMNRHYIATMHPGVGLALADWLEGIAAGWPWDGEVPGVVDWDGDRLLLANSLDSHALTVARLIVGEGA